jgi:hypothetical protein
MSLQNVRSARQESPSLSSGLDRGRSAAAVGRYSWGPQDDAASVATMRLALELGINWIDTAAVYGLATWKKLSAGYLDVVSADDETRGRSKAGQGRPCHIRLPAACDDGPITSGRLVAATRAAAPVLAPK